MKKDKGNYDRLLSVFLILIFATLIFTLVPYFYNEIKSEIAIHQALNEFDETANSENKSQTEENEEVKVAQGSLEDILNEINSDEAQSSEEDESSTSNSREDYSGPINFETVGKIEIPKTNINYPVFDEIGKKSLESGVAIAYGPGLNQVGNTVIYGHNFRNGKFFSNNKKLVNGDKIYITDLEGNKVEYRIYNVYITTPTDASYMIRQTDGRREISLQTCTDNNSGRIVIWATAD